MCYWTSTKYCKNTHNFTGQVTAHLSSHRGEQPLGCKQTQFWKISSLGLWRRHAYIYSSGHDERSSVLHLRCFFSLLNTEEFGSWGGWFKVMDCKLQRKELQATWTFQFRAPHCSWELGHLLLNCVVIVSSFPSGKSSKLLRCEGWREENVSSHYSEGSRTLLKPGKLQLLWKLQSRKQGDMNDHKLMDQINQLLNREKIFFICRILMN